MDSVPCVSGPFLGSGHTDKDKASLTSWRHYTVHTRGSPTPGSHTASPLQSFSERRLNVTLSNILHQSDWVWTFIQQTFIITSPGPGSSQKDTACPLQGLMNVLGKRISNQKTWETMDRDSQHSPQGSPEQRCATLSSGVRASHTHTWTLKRWTGVNQAWWRPE